MVSVSVPVFDIDGLSPGFRLARPASLLVRLGREQQHTAKNASTRKTGQDYLCGVDAHLKGQRVKMSTSDIGDTKLCSD